jgi:hypothetical protein
MPSGEVIEQLHTVEEHSRLTLWVDALDPRLADAGVSTIVEAQNAVPVVVQRAMWWPGPTAANLD